MRVRWTSDPCYAFYGVDGSDCSFLVYLSEVEWFCPPLAWRNQSATPTLKPPPRKQVTHQRLLGIHYHCRDFGPKFLEKARAACSTAAQARGQQGSVTSSLHERRLASFTSVQREEKIHREKYVTEYFSRE